MVTINHVCLNLGSRTSDIVEEQRDRFPDMSPSCARALISWQLDVDFCRVGAGAAARAATEAAGQSRPQGAVRRAPGRIAPSTVSPSSHAPAWRVARPISPCSPPVPPLHSRADRVGLFPRLRFLAGEALPGRLRGRVRTQSLFLVGLPEFVALTQLGQFLAGFSETCFGLLQITAEAAAPFRCIR